MKTNGGCGSSVLPSELLFLRSDKSLTTTLNQHIILSVEQLVDVRLYPALGREQQQPLHLSLRRLVPG